MKPRYNLRIQSTKLHRIPKNKKSPSRVAKKTKPSVINRRQSLRLAPVVKQTKPIPETIPKWRKVENDNEDENPSLIDNNDDDFDDLLTRHHQRMLEEQKDRKLYERYIRDQRTLRRLQCRRSHTGHLNESTKNRLLRELERERRYTIHDKICSYLANHRIIFQHGCNIESKQSITWSALEEEISFNRNIGTIHELDVMINNLKKVVRTSKFSIPKPRLSVRERLATVSPTKSDNSQVIEINSSPITLNSIMNLPPQLSLVSLSPRVPIVRFIDDQNNKIRPSNSQHLTCIQNVLSHHSRITTNGQSTPISIRKSFLRPKSPLMNASESSPAKKRAVEKENCSVPTTAATNNSDTNTTLKATLPMVSIKHTTSSSSSRSYPNTRKHLMVHSPLTRRRQTRLSATV